MVERYLPSVWRVGGGSWSLRDHPVLSEDIDCNVYLVRLQDSPVLVDCATLGGMAAVESNIGEAGFSPDDVSDLLLTHSHNDHTDGAQRWRSNHGIRTHLSVVGAEHLDRGDTCLLGGDYELFEVDHRIKDNEQFQIAGTTISTIPVPGHAPDCTLYTLELEGQVLGFCGDVCFAPADWDPDPGIVGTLGAPWKSNLRDYRESLKRMLHLRIDVLLPGHGFIVEGRRAARDTVAAALKTIERFLATPKIYAFYLPKKEEELDG